jgi:hypothetical protein
MLKLMVTWTLTNGTAVVIMVILTVTAGMDIAMDTIGKWDAELHTKGWTISKNLELNLTCPHLNKVSLFVKTTVKWSNKQKLLLSNLSKIWFGYYSTISLSYTKYNWRWINTLRKYYGTIFTTQLNILLRQVEVSRFIFALNVRTDSSIFQSHNWPKV